MADKVITSGHSELWKYKYYLISGSVWIINFIMIMNRIYLLYLVENILKIIFLF